MPIMKNDVRLPDFFIAGAMKCGTTTLHHILNGHPDVFIPPRENFFFNIDDFQQHPEFFPYHRGKWWSKEFNANFELYMKWYNLRFMEAADGQIIGDDTTTYLPSPKTHSRISELIPDAKLIVMLRDPASRTYSQYWRDLRTGRVVFDFEGSLRFGPSTLIERSLYKKQVESLLRFFPAEKLLFILFEEFIADMESEMLRVQDFLGLGGKIDLNRIETHHNPAQIPSSVNLHIWRNRLLRKMDGRKFIKRLPDMPLQSDHSLSYLIQRTLHDVHRKINPYRRVKAPQMSKETRHFLNSLFERENRGLSDLIGKDVTSLWYSDG